MSRNSLKRMSTHEDRHVSPPPLKRPRPSGTSQKAVSNFFTPLSQKEKIPEKVTWRIEQQSLVVGRYGPALDEHISQRNHDEDDKIKVAGFDFDSTLITTSSGNVFGKDVNDWKWWNGTVPGRLRALHEEGYTIVVFSNQSGISLASDSKSLKQDKKRFADFKTKATTVLSQLDIPISLYAATAKDMFRKPRTGMWDVFLSDHRISPATVNLEQSVFVGDAAGRAAAASHKKKDFSCSDRDFASNVCIPFATPEEFFLNQEPHTWSRDFDPGDYVETHPVASISGIPTTFTRKNDRDIVMFCGSPGAGKSTFYWKHLQPLGYERVNQDILKSRDKCLKYAEAFLREGTSIAIDNTNADEQTRAYWTTLAQKLNVPVRCVLFTASARLAEHNDAVRALNGISTNPEKRILLPKMAFTGFASRFQEPSLKEGFQDIVKVDFRFEGTDEQKAVWSKYWL